MRIVKIENTWDRDIEIPHNGELFVVKEGKSKIVPWDAVASLMGDPRARDDGKSRGRREIYEHTRGLWNFHMGFDAETYKDADRAGKPHDATWEAKCPQFKAWDASGNDGDDLTEIFFVIHDPDGLKTFKLSDPRETNTDALVLAKALADLQAQMAQMQAQLNLAKGAEPDQSVSSKVKPTVDASEADVKLEPVGGEEVELPKADPASAPKRDSPRAVRAG